MSERKIEIHKLPERFIDVLAQIQGERLVHPADQIEMPVSATLIDGTEVERVLVIVHLKGRQFSEKKTSDKVTYVAHENIADIKQSPAAVSKVDRYFTAHAPDIHTRSSYSSLFCDETREVAELYGGFIWSPFKLGLPCRYLFVWERHIVNNNPDEIRYFRANIAVNPEIHYWTDNEEVFERFDSLQSPEVQELLQRGKDYRTFFEETSNLVTEKFAGKILKRSEMDNEYELAREELRKQERYKYF